MGQALIESDLHVKWLLIDVQAGKTTLLLSCCLAFTAGWKEGKGNQGGIDFPVPDARPKRDRSSGSQLTAGWGRRETLPSKLKVA